MSSLPLLVDELEGNKTMKERATTDEPHSFLCPCHSVWDTTSSQNPTLATIQTFTVPHCIACAYPNRSNAAMYVRRLNSEEKELQSCSLVTKQLRTKAHMAEDDRRTSTKHQTNKDKLLNTDQTVHQCFEVFRVGEISIDSMTFIEQFLWSWLCAWSRRLK